MLTRASAELTMPQAEAIADNTLVYTVQSTMWALRCATHVLMVDTLDGWPLAISSSFARKRVDMELLGKTVCCVGRAIGYVANELHGAYRCPTALHATQGPRDPQGVQRRLPVVRPRPARHPPPAVPAHDEPAVVPG